MLTLIVCWSFLVHPFHVSVYDIEYNESHESVRITCRIFFDDLELALRTDSGNDTLDIMEDSLLIYHANLNYIKKNFKLLVNEKPADYAYLGGEIEGNVMWIYLEVASIPRLQSIEITNSILTEIYDDQQNITHFKIGDEKKSFILSAKKKGAKYSR